MKSIYLVLKVQNGEYEYYMRSVHQLEKGKHMRKFAKEYASTFYGDGGEDTFNDEAYYFNGGEVAVSVYSVCEITITEYEVLNKFL